MFVIFTHICVYRKKHITHKKRLKNKQKHEHEYNKKQNAHEKQTNNEQKLHCQSNTQNKHT